MKNIVICCDGTGNEFGANNSNVVKLFSVLRLDPAEQVAYYDPGLGTMGADNALTSSGKWITRQLSLAFGYGLMRNVEDAYRFLMQSWEPGDRLFLFGFSRGAYTVRALASVLHIFGLLPPNNAQLIPYILRLFKDLDNEKERIAREFKAVFSMECKPYFVGVWDTVSSIGWAYDPLTLRYTANNPDIQIGRQAISIDERRCFFRQNLWGKPLPHQDYKQVWFAGVHSDIGGGYAESESGLSKIALEWMLAEAVAGGLRVHPEKIEEVLGRAPGSKFVRPDVAARMHDSIQGAWKLLEYFPRRHWKTSVQPPKQHWRIPRKRPRTLRDPVVIHQSVQDRLNLPQAHYRPPNVRPEHLQQVEPWSKPVWLARDGAAT